MIFFAEDLADPECHAFIGRACSAIQKYNLNFIMQQNMLRFHKSEGFIVR